jgi:hypothetical protein
MKRAFLFILALFSIFFLPFYVTLVIGLVGFLLFPNYYEGVALGLIYDSLYFVPSGEGWPVWFLGSLVLFGVIYLLRPLIRN